MFEFCWQAAILAMDPDPQTKQFQHQQNHHQVAQMVLHMMSNVPAGSSAKRAYQVEI